MTIKQQGGIFGRNPSFNDVSANTTTTDTLTADASADGSVVTVKRDGSDVGSLGAKSGDFFISSDAMGMRFRDSISAIIPSVDGATGSDASFDLGNDSNRWRKLYLSGNLVVASGSGIDFSATSGTGTSELFSDYEEGTFTPIIEGASSAGTATYTSQVGLYTKVGRTVCISGQIVWSGHTGTGNMRLAGLPFGISSTGAASGAAAAQGIMTITGQAFLYPIANSTYCLIQALNSGSSSNMTVVASGSMNFQFFIVT